MRMRIPLTFLALTLLTASCGKDWLATQPGACVFDADCFAGFKCIDSRCLDIELGDPDGGTRLKEFGERCEDNAECLSTYCLAHPAGAFCSRLCEEGCPVGWECKLTPDPHGGPEPVGLCAVVQNRLCEPCIDDASCNVTGADRCLPIGGQEHCAVDCTFGDCPTGYTCVPLPDDPAQARQCLPDSSSCTCSDETLGQVRGCQRENQNGICGGFEECLAGPSWADCSAPEPAPESCNGADDDCDGFADEDLTGAACTIENEHGACQGFVACRGQAGWECAAKVPGPEECNIVDDNCNEQVDEIFRDGQGRYVHDQHCGSCGVDCDLVINHATQTTCDLVSGLPTCRALACEEGYFVYEEGLACLALPANLCLACGQDDDCVAPGSRCIENGTEQYCGRSCAADSPYGTDCPPGYACQPYQGEAQCQPVNDTCLCGPDSLGTVRSCLVDTCVGFQTCQEDGPNHTWTTCNVEDFNVEICDGVDNNCNGQIDEGFLNPQTGRYESDDHCGFCNNDCSLYFTPAIDHVYGVCDLAAQGLPSCEMGPCLTEDQGGVIYEWVDVDADTDNGCECRRVLGNTHGDVPDLFGEPVPGIPFWDENCDGVDGVIAHALFVRAGAAAGDGSLPSPHGSLTEAIAAWPGSNKRYLLVAEGRYDEDVLLVPGLELHGGYAFDFLSRDVVLHASVITGRDAWATMIGADIRGAATIVSGFIIRGRDIDQAVAVNVPGEPSVAVHLVDCDAQLELRSNQIVGGRGGDGGRGNSGAAGYGRADSNQLDGDDGRDGERRNGLFSNGCQQGSQNSGGAAGINSQCPVADGNPGGTTVCPVFDWGVNPVRGAQAQYTVDAGGDGLGGFDWSFDEMSGESCSHATESGYPTDIQLNVGHDGRDGLDAANGPGGQGATGNFGSAALGLWVPAPADASAGTDGQNGNGGGGGGGGGGTAYYHPGGNDCGEYELGPSGGGGGAAGCGGQSGSPGQAGGASIAVMVVKTALGPAANPTISANVLQRGQAGRGGDGGAGGQGGLGGLGGFGGDQASWISSLGGKGGDGGNGGPGGGGGGGAGGPSFDLIGLDVSTATYAGSNLFGLDESSPTSGAGGDGGVSVGPGATGDSGVPGAYGNRLELTTCGAGGTCPAGSTCDPNQICVPEN